MVEATDTGGTAVRVYTTKWCGYCFAARRLLRRSDIAFEDISLDGNPDLRRRVSRENGGWPTVPMIFVNGIFVGGYSELRSLCRKGGLVSGGGASTALDGG